MNNRKISIAFGAVLRELRERRKLSQEALAFESGMNRGHLSMLELGNKMPTIRTMFILSDTLQVPFVHFASLLTEKLKEISDE